MCIMDKTKIRELCYIVLCSVVLGARFLAREKLNARAAEPGITKISHRVDGRRD